MNRIKMLWSTNKPLLISLLLFILLFIRLLVSTFYIYTNLSAIYGNVKKISVSNDNSKIYATLILQNDDKLYYQRYSHRFFDEALVTLKVGKSLNFYTSKSSIYKSPPLWNDGHRKGFYYFPIFNVNTPKSILDIFLFNFYRLTVLNFLLYISIVATIIYSFYYIVHSSGLARGLFFVFLAVMFWLWY